MVNRRIVMAVGAAGLVLGALALWAGAQQIYSAEEVVRYDRDSKYYKIRVVDYPKEGRRCLHFSKSRGVQSSMFLDDPVKLDLRYSKSMIAAMTLHPAPKDVLLVGLGGASVPKFIQKYWPDVRLDVVEIDIDVVKVCQEFFEFKGTPNTRVVVMDGRMYFKRSPKKYDIIMLDAYTSDRIPFHLTTVEFVELVKARLNPGGLVATNLWEHSVNRFYLAELATYKGLFPQTYLFKAADSGNHILFASLDPEQVRRDDWVARAVKAVDKRDFGFDLPKLVASEYEYLTPREIREKPLTDDMAPVDTLRSENPKYFDKP